MEDEHEFPLFRQVVLDTTDARQLAEFYRQLLGFVYRNGDEPLLEGELDSKGRNWLVIQDPSSASRLAFQQVGVEAPSTWPGQAIPQQLHVDMTVATPRSAGSPARTGVAARRPAC